jgi:hypothetical protein
VRERPGYLTEQRMKLSSPEQRVRASICTKFITCLLSLVSNIETFTELAGQRSVDGLDHITLNVPGATLFDYIIGIDKNSG